MLTKIIAFITSAVAALLALFGVQPVQYETQPLFAETSPTLPLMLFSAFMQELNFYAIFWKSGICIAKNPTVIFAFCCTAITESHI